MITDPQPLIAEIVAELKRVPGIAAIALGGSRARGTHTPESDIDLGICYERERPLDVAALDRVAAALDDRHRAGLVTAIGGWGPWINGGGWLTIRSQAVDFLYRDLDRVAGVIDACLAGQVEMVYQPGHPHGFVSSIYVAEVATCQVLWDPHGRLAALRARAVPYPDALRQALIDKFAWEIDFSLQVGRKAIPRADVAYAAGACFRAVACMLQVLFALNRVYWHNEKGAVVMADAFPIRPPQLRARIEAAFAALGAGGLEHAIAGLESLSREIAVLLRAMNT